MTTEPNQIDTDKIRADLQFMLNASALRVLVRMLCDELDNRRDMIKHTQHQRNAELLELERMKAELAKSDKAFTGAEEKIIELSNEIERLKAAKCEQWEAYRG